MTDSLIQQMCVENVLQADLLAMLLPSPGWITGPCISATNFFLQPVEGHYFSCQALLVKKEYLVRAVWVPRVKASIFHLYHSPLFAKAWNVPGGAWKKGGAGSGGHTLQENHACLLFIPDASLHVCLHAQPVSARLLTLQPSPCASEVSGIQASSLPSSGPRIFFCALNRSSAGRRSITAWMQETDCSWGDSQPTAGRSQWTEASLPSPTSSFMLTAFHKFLTAAPVETVINTLILLFPPSLSCQSSCFLR